MDDIMEKSLREFESFLKRTSPDELSKIIKSINVEGPLVEDYFAYFEEKAFFISSQVRIPVSMPMTESFTEQPQAFEQALAS